MRNKKDLKFSVHCFCVKAECQCMEDEEDSNILHDGDIAEFDGMVVEMAGSLLGPLAAIVREHYALPLLKPLITQLEKKLVHSTPPLLENCSHTFSFLQCKNSSVAERSFVVGTLAEVRLTTTIAISIVAFSDSVLSLVTYLMYFFLHGRRRWRGMVLAPWS